MDKADVDRWLQAYVAAWYSYDPGQIEALFAEDVTYRYHPYDEPVTRRAAVVEAWLGEDAATGESTRDQPGTYEAGYRAVAVDGQVAVAVGSTSYRSEPGGPVVKAIDNCFVIRFDDDGRCTDFTEWYMKHPV